MEIIIPRLALHNGISMPQFGLGVWQAQDGQEVETAVKTALSCGYRLIDTAAIYGNEEGVGRALRESGVPREELFITTKLWNDSHEYDAALRAFDKSLARLGLDYVDLYLIHWPLPHEGKFPEAWRALEKIYADGRAKAIGVSNFTAAHLTNLLETAQVVPAVNQIELHPKLQQRATREFCAQHDIKVESYSPIMHGGEVLGDPVVIRIAEAHGKTPAQVVLRWHIQHGLIVIPKSVHEARIRENIAIFDFELAPGEMQLIDDLDEGRRVAPDPDVMRFK